MTQAVGSAPAPDAGVERPRLWGATTLLSGAIAVALLVFLATTIDLDAVWRELVRCDKGLVLLGLLAHYATYLVRGARWRRVLRHLQHRVGYWMFGLLVFFYNFVDNLVPAKLGDLYGAHLARINLGVTRSAALGSIVFLRMIDAWIVVGLAAWSSFVVFARHVPDAVVWALGFGAFVAFVASALLLTFALLKKVPTARWPEAIRRRVESFQVGMWPRRREFATVALLTLVIWILEAVWIWLLALAFGLSLDVAEVTFVTTISLLASAVPLTPAGVGFVEIGLYGCLSAVGASATLAASVTVLNRFIDYWLHIALGLVAWAFRRRLGLRTWTEAPCRSGGADPAGSPV